MSALGENKLFVTRPRLHMEFLRAFSSTSAANAKRINVYQRANTLVAALENAPILHSAHMKRSLLMHFMRCRP
jgi:hypothetical protein